MAERARHQEDRKEIRTAEDSDDEDESENILPKSATDPARPLAAADVVFEQPPAVSGAGSPDEVLDSCPDYSEVQEPTSVVHAQSVPAPTAPTVVPPANMHYNNQTIAHPYADAARWGVDFDQQSARNVGHETSIQRHDLWDSNLGRSSASMHGHFSSSLEMPVPSASQTSSFPIDLSKPTELLVSQNLHHSGSTPQFEEVFETSNVIGAMTLDAGFPAIDAMDLDLSSADAFTCHGMSSFAVSFTLLACV